MTKKIQNRFVPFIKDKCFLLTDFFHCYWCYCCCCCSLFAHLHAFIIYQTDSKSKRNLVEIFLSLQKPILMVSKEWKKIERGKKYGGCVDARNPKINLTICTMIHWKYSRLSCCIYFLLSRRRCFFFILNFQMCASANRESWLI